MKFDYDKFKSRAIRKKVDKKEYAGFTGSFGANFDESVEDEGELIEKMRVLDPGSVVPFMTTGESEPWWDETCTVELWVTQFKGTEANYVSWFDKYSARKLIKCGNTLLGAAQFCSSADSMHAAAFAGAVKLSDEGYTQRERPPAWYPIPLTPELFGSMLCVTTGFRITSSNVKVTYEGKECMATITALRPKVESETPPSDVKHEHCAPWVWWPVNKDGDPNVTEELAAKCHLMPHAFAIKMCRKEKSATVLPAGSSWTVKNWYYWYARFKVELPDYACPIEPFSVDSPLQLTAFQPYCAAVSHFEMVHWDNQAALASFMRHIGVQKITGMLSKKFGSYLQSPLTYYGHNIGIGDPDAKCTLVNSSPDVGYDGWVYAPSSDWLSSRPRVIGIIFPYTSDSLALTTVKDWIGGKPVHMSLIVGKSPFVAIWKDPQGKSGDIPKRLYRNIGPFILSAGSYFILSAMQGTYYGSNCVFEPDLENGKFWWKPVKVVHAPYRYMRSAEFVPKDKFKKKVDEWGDSLPTFTSNKKRNTTKKP